MQNTSTVTELHPLFFKLRGVSQKEQIIQMCLILLRNRFCPISVGCRRDVPPLALHSLNLEISIRHDFLTLNRQREGISV